MWLSPSVMDKNWEKLSQTSRDIVTARKSAPAKYTGYADHLYIENLYAYAFYVGFRQYLKSPGLVVDWGGQYGHVTRMLAAYFGDAAECYLVDNRETEQYWHSVLNIRNVRSPKPGAFVGILDHDDGVADAVVSSGVLEHTFAYGVTDLDALRDIYRVLKKDGYLFIWHLPSKMGMPELINKVLGRWYHHCRYEHDQLVQLINLAGFRIVKFKKQILHPRLRAIAMKIFGFRAGFTLDHLLSKVPLLSIFAQHFTVVAQKMEGFSFPSQRLGSVVQDSGAAPATQ